MSHRRRPFTARLLLAAYPRAFRRQFGDEVARAVADLRRHRRLGRWALLARLTVDVVRSAPKLRWESMMSRIRFRPLAVAMVLSVGLMAMLVGSGVYLAAIGAVVALLALVVRSADRPIVADPEVTARWHRWIAAGAVSFAIGFVILVIDGDELTTPGWAVWALSWATGVVLVVFGFVLAAAHLLRRPTR
jgi:hypothetical protein